MLNPTPPDAELAARRSRGERVAAYLLEHVRQRSPHKWRQAPRKQPAAAGGPASNASPGTPSLAAFATHGVLGVSELAVRGLWHVANGFPVDVLDSAPTAKQVLGLQASGARCVTLLPASSNVPAPHSDPLDFALHDLCHLAKFADAALFCEQVGFFATLERALEDERWQAAESELDDTWRSDCLSVAADMNGSSVYLFAVLKMRLKMAARRCLARRRGIPAPVAGKATPDEEAQFGELFGPLLEAMALPDDVRRAAWATSARRDDPLAAACLAAHFAERARSR